MKETNRIEYKQKLAPYMDIKKEVIVSLNAIEGDFDKYIAKLEGRRH